MVRSQAQEHAVAGGGENMEVSSVWRTDRVFTWFRPNSSDTDAVGPLFHLFQRGAFCESVARLLSYRPIVHGLQARFCRRRLSMRMLSP